LIATQRFIGHVAPFHVANLGRRAVAESLGTVAGSGRKRRTGLYTSAPIGPGTARLYTSITAGQGFALGWVGTRAGSCAANSIEIATAHPAVGQTFAVTRCGCIPLARAGSIRFQSGCTQTAVGLATARGQIRLIPLGNGANCFHCIATTRVKASYVGNFAAGCKTVSRGPRASRFEAASAGCCIGATRLFRTTGARGRATNSIGVATGPSRATVRSIRTISVRAVCREPLTKGNTVSLCGTRTSGAVWLIKAQLFIRQVGSGHLTNVGNLYIGQRVGIVARHIGNDLARFHTIATCIPAAQFEALVAGSRFSTILRVTVAKRSTTYSISVTSTSASSTIPFTAAAAADVAAPAKPLTLCHSIGLNRVDTGRAIGLLETERIVHNLGIGRDANCLTRHVAVPGTHQIVLIQTSGIGKLAAGFQTAAQDGRPRTRRIEAGLAR
jgi:hypothetical protein